jgi:hypothetical protein
MSFTKVAPAGIGTEPGNSILIGDSLLHSTGIDIGSNTGIGVTIRKHGDATFTGIITASAFFGDGSGLEGVSSSGIGTPLSDDDTSDLNKIYYVNQELSIGSTITVNHPSSAVASYTHYQDLVVTDDADFIVSDGDTFIPDVLGIRTSTSTASAATGGRIRAGTITNAGANGAPNFPNGLTGTAGTFTGNLNVAGVLTYEDVTNVDSVGLITARSGVNVVGNDLNVGSNIKIGNASGIVTATSFSGSGANLTSLPAANLTGALPAISGANLTGLTSGITMIDSWSITSNFTQGAGNTEVTANWRRNYAGSTYWGVLGSAMTESSGVFSFPTTGIYLVQFNFHGRSNGSAQSYIGARLFVSQNAGVGYGQMAFNYSQAYASQAHFNCSNSAILDVTNISNTKFRFNTEVESSTIWFGESNAPKIGSGFYVIRLGDT